MKKFIYKVIIAGTVILFQATLCFGQDSSKIIILSSRVGTSIDSKEQDYFKFKLFQRYDGFNDAIVYKGTDSLFYCKISFSKDTSLKDTTFNISYGIMINWAKKIKYFELLKKGDYKLDHASITLRYANGEIVEITKTDKKKLLINGYDISKRIPLNEKKLDNEKLIKEDFQLGVSFGVVHNLSTFDGLGDVFNLLEENIPEDPYVVEKTNFTFKSTPLLSIGVLGLYKNMIMGEIEYSFSIPANDKSELSYDSFIISVSYLFQFSQSILPYLSAGYMGYNFEVLKNYGVTINARDGTLKSITLKGNANGPVFGLGIIFNIGPTVNINLFGRYKVLGNPKVKQEIQNLSDFETNVDADGFEIGVTLIFK